MRRAFTLLELLAATALSALLMAAVLPVLATIGRDGRAMAQRPGPQVWRADLLDALRHDLAGSTGMQYGTNALVLTGQAALDRDTLVPRNEPVTITYSVALLHGRTWLTRRQVARGAADSGRPWMELLCPDVAGFSVRPAATELGASLFPGKAADAWQSVPASVVVRVETAGQPPVEETLVLR